MSIRNRNLVKVGTGTNTLSGVNLYTGTTTVNKGTLKLSTGTTLQDGTSLMIGSDLSAKVELAAGVNETVNALYIDGKQQAKGTWGCDASSTTPANKNNDHFAGTGILTVTTGPANGTLILLF